MVRQENNSKRKATVNKAKSKQTPAQRTKANKAKSLKKTPAQRAKASKAKSLKQAPAQRAKANKANSSKQTQSKQKPAAQQAKANNAKSSKQTSAQRRSKAGKANSSKQAPTKRSKARKANSSKQTPAQRAKASKVKALKKVPAQRVKANQAKSLEQAPTWQTNELTRYLHSLPMPPSERQRMDELPGSSGSYIQHPQHWYPDGNLLLQIGTVRFKLYGGRLATESPFFAALLEQRKGKHDSKPYEYQGEMVQVLSTAERVNGVDLFFLDPRNELISAPNANEFAVLLTTMNSAVDFTYNLPSFKDVCSIWKAAVFYEMESYKKFCQRYFNDLFPDTWSTISTIPCDIERAVICARLGTEHSRMRCIRRPAFYDLARTPLFSNAVLNGSDGMTQMKMTKTQKLERRKELKKLGADNMVTLLELQRRLGLKWFDIINLMHIPCVKKCTPPTSIMHFVRPIYEELPYDPIIGIRRLLKDEELSSTFCEHTVDQAKKKLRREGRALWKAFAVWIHEISSNASESESDSTSSLE